MQGSAARDEIRTQQRKSQIDVFDANVGIEGSGKTAPLRYGRKAALARPHRRGMALSAISNPATIDPSRYLRFRPLPAVQGFIIVAASLAGRASRSTALPAPFALHATHAK